MSEKYFIETENIVIHIFKMCVCVHCVVTDHYSLMLSSVLLMICYSSHVDEILRKRVRKKKITYNDVNKNDECGANDDACKGDDSDF